MNALAVPMSSHAASATAPCIHAIGLGLAIDERLILRDIDLSITPGEFVAVLGANGAGKSTLLKIVATLTHATHGELRLFGQSARRDSAALRARIGLIAHQSMLYRDLSARENLLFFAKLYGVNKPEQRVELLLDVIGLTHRGNDALKSFSRGMVQRVAIARALLHDPELILADEPFDGLDAPSLAGTEQLLQHLHRNGKTVLLVNHDIRQSLQLARRIIVLRRGCVTMDAAADSVEIKQVLAEMEAP